MRCVLVAPLLVLFTGCALVGSPRVHGTTFLSQDEAFSVAVGTLTSMGYSIQSAERERGYVVARKQVSSVGVASAAQLLQVSLSSGDDGTKFRITANSQRLSTQLGERTVHESAAARVKHDAERLKQALVRVTGDESGDP